MTSRQRPGRRGSTTQRASNRPATREPGAPAHRRPRCRGSRWPTTVWPCAATPPQADGQPVPGWLNTAVARLVTTYTQPGHRVLLHTPPDPTPTRHADLGRPGPDADPYTGLRHTAQTVTRLGRSAITRAANRSGPGPHPHIGPDHHPDSDPTDSNQSHPDSPASPVDLILTAVHPHATTWTQTIPWPTLVTPTGVLAVITHSDRRDGRFIDPAPELVTTMNRAGLRYLDHAALLCVPLRAGRLLSTTPEHHPTHDGHAHHDLLTFQRPTRRSEASHG